MKNLTIRAIDRMIEDLERAERVDDRSEKYKIRRKKLKNWVSIHENKKQAADRQARHCSAAYHLRKL